jgi:hypothetical protein
MKKSRAAFAATAAFSSLATAQGPHINSDLFSERAAAIAAVSAENCDPATTVATLDATRPELLELREARTSSPLDSFRVIAIARANKVSICWDTRLAGSGYESVHYLGLPRIVTLNPDYAAQAPAVLLRSLQSMQARFGEYANGKLTDAEIAKPLGFSAAGSTGNANKIPREAPHKKPDYRLDASQLAN